MRWTLRDIADTRPQWLAVGGMATAEHRPDDASNPAMRLIGCSTIPAQWTRRQVGATTRALACSASTRNASRSRAKACRPAASDAVRAAPASEPLGMDRQPIRSAGMLPPFSASLLNTSL